MVQLNRIPSENTTPIGSSSVPVTFVHLMSFMASEHTPLPPLTPPPRPRPALYRDVTCVCSIINQNHSKTTGKESERVFFSPCTNSEVSVHCSRSVSHSQTEDEFTIGDFLQSTFYRIKQHHATTMDGGGGDKLAFTR